MKHKSTEETNLQNKIKAALSEYGIVIRQQSGVFKTQYEGWVKIGVPGISDLQFIGPDGKVAFIEVKARNGRPSEEQKNFIKQVQALGHRAGVAYSVEDALEIAGVI